MAAPIAHIYCALMILSSGLLRIDNQRDFIIGIMFPDIRYLANMPRNTTHSDTVEWRDVVQANNSFYAGLQLHSLVDNKRIALLEKKIETFLPGMDNMRYTLYKVAEDCILYEQGFIKGSTFAKMFGNIISAEQQFGIGDETITTWHQFLEFYYQSKSNNARISVMFDYIINHNNNKQIGADLKTYYEKNKKMVMDLIKDTNFKKIVCDFYNDITAIVTETNNTV